MTEKITIADLRDMKRKGEKIACLTAYDASFARVLDAAGVDVLLVGDSLGMVLHGHEDTLQVTMDDMVYHTRLVHDGRKRALLISDMPFMSYADLEQALRNASRLMSQGSAEVIKLEGGADVADIVRHLDRHGIPVCGHIGLQPQSIHKYGGYRVQGRDEQSAERILADARVLEEAGAVMIVLECIPAKLAARVTAALSIPTIGIGAGSDCDGQVLVLYDVLGISPFVPRMAKCFVDGGNDIAAAIGSYVQAVKSREFPGSEHTFR